MSDNTASPSSSASSESPPKKPKLDTTENADESVSDNDDNPRKSVTCLVNQTCACPVCFEVPRGKVFVCVNGHNICEVCFNKAKKKSLEDKVELVCPQGRCPYNPQDVTRNRTVEQLVQLSGIRLKCGHDGCEVKVPVTELSEHESDCRYKEIKCPSENRTCRVSRASLVSHYLERHRDIAPNDLLSRRKYTINKGLLNPNYTSSWPQRLRKMPDPRNPGEDIHVFSALKVKNGDVVAYIMADLMDTKCKDLKVTISLAHPSYSLSFKGPLQDLEKTSSELVGLAIPYPLLREVVHDSKDGFLRLNIDHEISF